MTQSLLTRPYKSSHASAWWIHDLNWNSCAQWKRFWQSCSGFMTRKHKAKHLNCNSKQVPTFCWTRLEQVVRYNGITLGWVQLHYLFLEVVELNFGASTPGQFVVDFLGIGSKRDRAVSNHRGVHSKDNTPVISCRAVVPNLLLVFNRTANSLVHANSRTISKLPDTVPGEVAATPCYIFAIGCILYLRAQMGLWLKLCIDLIVVFDRRGLCSIVRTVMLFVFNLYSSVETASFFNFQLQTKNWKTGDSWGRTHSSHSGSHTW